MSYSYEWGMVDGEMVNGKWAGGYCLNLLPAISLNIC